MLVEASSEVLDLSKAKIKFLQPNPKDSTKTQNAKIGYTGKEIELATSKEEYANGGYQGWIEVTIGSGKNVKSVDLTDSDIKITYVNNIAKGKATVIISGGGTTYAGSFTGTFNIGAHVFNTQTDLSAD